MFNGINEGGLNNILSQRLGVKGSAAAPAVAPEVFPNLTLENDRPEWGFVKQEYHRGVYRFSSAVAGQYNFIQLYIPTTEQSVAVVTRIRQHDSQQIQIGRGPINAAIGAGWTLINGVDRDMRTVNSGKAVQVAVNTTASAGTFGVFAASVAATDPWDEPIILGPTTGSALIIRNNLVNNTLSIDIQWYERTALPGELV